MTTPRNPSAHLGLAVGLALTLLGCSISSDGGTGAQDSAPPTTAPTTASAAVPDGEWFGFVSIVREGEELVVSFDDAEMLVGDAARRAAVDAGIIDPGEDLPNDFFIANPDPDEVALRVASGAEFSVISGLDTGVEMVTDIDGIESLYSGAYDGPPVYGIVPGVPIAMQVDVSGGELIAAHAVYLP